MTKSDISNRWKERVVANGWDKAGAAGAMCYLARYGKNIGKAKLEALASYADGMGCVDFAAVLRGGGGVSYYLDSITEKTVSDEGWNDDAQDLYNDIRNGDSGEGTEAKYVRGTADEFAKRGIGSIINENESVFEELAQLYPLMQIRGCLDVQANVVGCVDCCVDSVSQGIEVGTLIGYRFDDGGVNWDEPGPHWAYFESE